MHLPEGSYSLSYNPAIYIHSDHHGKISRTLKHVLKTVFCKCNYINISPSISSPKSQLHKLFMCLLQLPIERTQHLLILTSPIKNKEKICQIKCLVINLVFTDFTEFFFPNTERSFMMPVTTVHSDSSSSTTSSDHSSQQTGALSDYRWGSPKRDSHSDHIKK